jgi:hypothetical protein
MAESVCIPVCPPTLAPELLARVRELAELKANDKGPLDISERCKRVGRTDEYQSLYALYCLDTHNNGAALGDRHVSEQADGTVQMSIFGEYDPQVTVMRLDWGLKFLLDSARMIHGAFQMPALEIDSLAARLEAERTKESPAREHPAAKPA